MTLNNKDDICIIILILVGMLIIICCKEFLSQVDHLEQEKLIHDLCIEYYKQINKTKDSNPKITEICLPRKFSIKEYSEVLNEK